MDKEQRLSVIQLKLMKKGGSQSLPAWRFSSQCLTHTKKMFKKTKKKEESVIISVRKKSACSSNCKMFILLSFEPSKRNGQKARLPRGVQVFLAHALSVLSMRGKGFRGALSRPRGSVPWQSRETRRSWPPGGGVCMAIEQISTRK
jgi:hypothetical protein